MFGGRREEENGYEDEEGELENRLQKAGVEFFLVL